MALENIIAVAIFLLILSQMSERLANFCRLWLSGRQLNPFPKRTERTRVRNLRDQPRTQEESKEKDEGILFINILCGWLVAFTCLMYLKGLPKQGVPDAIEWLIADKGLSQILFVLLGGFFLSFGSKFWHDMLDLLYAAKKIKQQIADPGTYQPTTLEDLDAQLDLTRENIRVAEVELEKELMEKFPEAKLKVNGRNEMIDGVRRWRLVVDVSEARTPIQITSPIKVRGTSAEHDVEVIIRELGSTKTHAGICGTIRNNDNPLELAGTLGCVVKDRNDKTYVLSCYHVMRHAGVDHDWNYLSSKDHVTIVAANGAGGWDEIARLARGRRTNWTDVAIAEINENQKINRNLLTNGAFSGMRNVIDEDVWYRTWLSFHGAKTDRLLGAAICNRDVSQWILYADGYQLMNGLIEISIPQGATRTGPTQEGDSGLVAYDSEGKAIGLLIGGNPQCSYLIPIETALNTFDLQLA